MLCREGPSTNYVDRWQLDQGEIVPVLARWYEDPNWLLVDINATETRTDCCWVGGEGTLMYPQTKLRPSTFCQIAWIALRLAEQYQLSWYKHLVLWRLW